MNNCKPRTALKGNSPAKTSRSGFTLVELLVVIAILAILISLLLPALAGAKNQAQRVVCAANIRSLIQAVKEYAQENKNNYPQTDIYDWQFGGLGYQSPPYGPWGLALLYSNGFLKDPSFIYCPQSGFFGPQGTYADGTPPFYLPDAVKRYITSGGNYAATNWPQHLNWISIFSSYSYWYGRPNAIETFSDSYQPISTWPTVGPVINPLTSVVTNYNYQADPTLAYSQGPLSNSQTILISDLTASYQGSFTNFYYTGWTTTSDSAFSNHMTATGAPDGGNIGHNDGSVTWKPFDQMKIGYTYLNDYWN